MARTPMARLELNLLVALDALLTERSVTRAAEKLQLSQPALSASLARLRVHFSDPLLIRDGNTYRLTPLAARLGEQTAIALDAARKVFANEATFDASTSNREFTVYGSDYAFATVGAAVANGVRRDAPGIRFRFVQHSPAIVEDPMNSLRTVDGMLLPHGFTTDLPCLDVYEDEWVCLVAADNPLVGDELTMDHLRDLPWVFTYQSRSAFTPAGRQLQMIGVEPRIDVVVEGFLALPFFLMGTERIGMVQRKVAERFVAGNEMRMLKPPFDVVRLAGALWWHPMHTEDPAHVWMRQQFLHFGRAS
ncbi:MAG TPA: LysR family transcriptional regulator [Amnibacterium sp.]|jgi:DNA-binding transcriptional LysR family regulator|uniref:LysR family transcriptional regulator n=1 Tax=Amnibacterium sp. TaxID=1872496 RepID=UPI002F948148